MSTWYSATMVSEMAQNLDPFGQVHYPNVVYTAEIDENEHHFVPSEGAWLKDSHEDCLEDIDMDDFIDYNATLSSGPSPPSSLPQKKVYPCTYVHCDKSFDKPGRLKTHVNTKHTKKKPYICGGRCGDSSCTKKYPSPGNLKRHYIAERVPCETCGKEIASQNIARHRKNIHAPKVTTA